MNGTGPKEAAHRPVILLLLLCARTRMDTQTADRVKTLLLQEKMDWASLYQAAIQHLQIPLLYRNISRIAPELAAKDFLTKLQNDSFHISAWNLFLTDELTKLVSLLRDNDIRSIPFKGPVLASTIYQDLSLRVFTDLDIFVRTQDLEKIEKLLAGNGYKILQETHQQKAFVLKHKYHLQFLDPEKRVIIEVHWKFTRDKLSFPIDEHGLWRRTQCVTLAGSEVKTFCPEDLLLLLCIHGAKHRWMRLGWLCDIAELIKLHPDLNWTELLHAAKKMRVLRILFLGLHLAQDLLDTPIPNDVSQQMNGDVMAGSIAESVKNYLLSGDVGVLDEEPVFYRKIREKVRDKAMTSLYYFRLDSSTRKNHKLGKMMASVNFLRRMIRI